MITTHRCIIRRLTPGSLLSRSSNPSGNISTLARAIPILISINGASGFLSFWGFERPWRPHSDHFLCLDFPRPRHPHPHQNHHQQPAATKHTTPPRHHTIACQCDWWRLNLVLAGRGSSESKTWLVEKDVSHSTVNGRAHSAGSA